MSYVDGFVVAVPRKNIEAYKKFSTFAGSLWTVQAKEDELVVFSWITYRSRQSATKSMPR
ncbi:uncharacterized protein YbaA (DUF1428 family) [Rhizobium lentis]|uniref:Uncharacterized protein YbaA (DUF1428 family) n=1 Tax=Rhizobium lentis TaxID=1138194 RepID=A0A7W8XBG5_9HYPH|nr:uncharacterized protein YbaA (DUF1428 family) [Rhizobium lentis]MBB5548555.1 uncharacterized protein YbaA (DUF1428 family) [Rhizobium lentis]MBB5559085.1 uncharacterized protein YbaA (DUF1428 family) [Rhizobium lentis]MBB5565392.1 uncharacterized protein YbaA (DUF1428 family) [Rhizobium lentis]